MALPTEFQFLGGAQSLEATWYTQQNFRQIELLFDKFIRNYIQSRAFNGTQIVGPSDTNEHDFHTTAIAAGELRKNGAVRIFAAGTATGAAGNKTTRIYFGGSQAAGMTVPAAAGSTGWWMEATVYNRNSETSQGVMQLVASGTQISVGFSTLAIDTSATGGATSTAGAIAIKSTGQLANATDGITGEVLIVEIVPSLT